MKPFKTIAIAALAAGVAGTALNASTTAYAQGGQDRGNGKGWHMAGGKGGPGGRRGGARMMERFDVNGDGAITQEEVDEVTSTQFSGIDADNSNGINLEEFRAEFAMRSNDRSIRVFQRLDRDGDGMVTTEEFTKVTDRLFSRLDRDDNGELEMRRGQRGRKGAGNSAESVAPGADGKRQASGGRGEGRGQAMRHARHGHRGHPNPMVMLFDVFDTNGDGKITRAEFEEVRGKLFASADTDGSGAFSLEDFSNIWMTMNDARVVRMFQRLDADGDLTVTAEEQAARTSDMVERRDRNGDGVITKADFKKGKHGKKRHGRSDDGPRKGRDS